MQAKTNIIYIYNKFILKSLWCNPGSGRSGLGLGLAKVRIGWQADKCNLAGAERLSAWHFLAVASPAHGDKRRYAYGNAIAHVPDISRLCGIYYYEIHPLRNICLSHRLIPRTGKNDTPPCWQVGWKYQRLESHSECNWQSIKFMQITDLDSAASEREVKSALTLDCVRFLISPQGLCLNYLQLAWETAMLYIF